MTPLCYHCTQPVVKMDYKPTGNPYVDLQDSPDVLWATDESGDPNEDFICPRRETSSRWPNGKPHRTILDDL